LRVHRSSPLILVLVATCLVAACSGGTKSAAPTVPATTTEPPTTTSSTTLATTTSPPPTAPPVPVAPEVGVPDPTGESLTRPALWVKVENTPEARPQAGLDEADVVYEQVTEAGITRFITLFNSQLPDVVGPIRSTRAMDSDVVAPLGGVFAYSGGIPQSVDLINHAPVAAVDETAAKAAMFRDRSKRAPHNLYGHPTDLLALGADQPRPVPALFSYLPAGQAFTGDPISAFRVDFDAPYAPIYSFDPASRTWLRSIGLAPFTAASGQQIAPTNVIVQFVPCCLPVPEGGTYMTVGTGEAWVFSDGKMVQGTWTRNDRSEVTTFLDANNQPIRLNPGRTWVEFVPNGDNVDVLPPSDASPTSSAP
jgi:hypothetical protein